jgi:hypothetical protein
MASISRSRRRTHRRAAPHRRSKRGATEDEDDRLSSLPDDLLHSILHAVPLKHPARTSPLFRLVCSAGTDGLHGATTEESIASERVATMAAGQAARGGEGEESDERAWTRRLGGRLALPLPYGRPVFLSRRAERAPEATQQASEHRRPHSWRTSEHRRPHSGWTSEHQRPHSGRVITGRATPCDNRAEGGDHALNGAASTGCTEERECGD